MNPLAFLGFTPDADGAYDASQVTASAVKRTYAQKLKITRPDDDPAGFQQLNEAYRAALEICQRLQPRKAAQTPPADEPANPPTPASSQTGSPADLDNETAPPQPVPSTRSAWAFDIPAAPPPSPPQTLIFSPDDFLRELQQAAAQNDNPDALDQWLQKHPALYALQNKARADAILQQRLANDEFNALTPDQYKVLAAFFDFWLDPQWLQRHAAQRAIQTGDFSDFAEQPLTGLYGNRFLLNRIKRPLSYWRAIGVAAFPWMPMRIVQIGQILRTNYGLAPTQLPPGLDAASLAFYTRLANSGYFGRWRWAQIALRSCVLPAVMTVLMAVMTTLNYGLYHNWWWDTDSIKTFLLGMLYTVRFLFTAHLMWSGAAWLWVKYSKRKRFGWRVSFILMLFVLMILKVALRK
jgi:chromate transport protein ChrA